MSSLVPRLNVSGLVPRLTASALPSTYSARRLPERSVVMVTLSKALWAMSWLSKQPLFAMTLAVCVVTTYRESSSCSVCVCVCHKCSLTSFALPVVMFVSFSTTGNLEM